MAGKVAEAPDCTNVNLNAAGDTRSRVLILLHHTSPSIVFLPADWLLLHPIPRDGKYLLNASDIITDTITQRG